MSTEPALPALGERLGGYVLERVIGRGAMGAVYVGRNDAGASRAIKVPLFPGTDGPELRARFRREAEALARLNERGVVRVHAAGEERGQPFCVLELIEGRTLAQALREDGRLPIARALELGAQLARALAAVHVAGLVHRDVKPSNILLRAEDGSAALADFGLVRASELASLTATNLTLGTPGYMAPEQIDAAHDVDGRADIYALGATLHELLTGAPAFSLEGGVEAVLRRTLREAPAPPSASRPEIPEEVDELIARALAKRREDRFPSATDLALALEDARRGLDRPRARRRPVAVVAALVVTAAAAAAVLLRGPPPPSPVAGEDALASWQRHVASVRADVEAERSRADPARELPSLHPLRMAIAALATAVNAAPPVAARERDRELERLRALDVERDLLVALAALRDGRTAAALEALAGLRRQGEREPVPAAVEALAREGVAPPRSPGARVLARLRGFALADGSLREAPPWLAELLKRDRDLAVAAVHELLLRAPAPGPAGSAGSVVRALGRVDRDLVAAPLLQDSRIAARLHLQARGALGRGSSSRAALRDVALAIRLDPAQPWLTSADAVVAGVGVGGSDLEPVLDAIRAGLPDVQGALSHDFHLSAGEAARKDPDDWAARLCVLEYLQGNPLDAAVAAEFDVERLWEKIVRNPETPAVQRARAHLLLALVLGDRAGRGGMADDERARHFERAVERALEAARDHDEPDRAWQVAASHRLSRHLMAPRAGSTLLDQALDAATRATALLAERERRTREGSLARAGLPPLRAISGRAPLCNAWRALLLVRLARRELAEALAAADDLARAEGLAPYYGPVIRAIALLCLGRTDEARAALGASLEDAGWLARELDEVYRDVLVALGYRDVAATAHAWAARFRSGEWKTRQR